GLVTELDPKGGRTMDATNLYDAVAYPGFAYAQTHPDRLWTVGTLFGMTPAPVDRCRVLEVGCGDGRNLLAMASSLPESTFVGFDLAGQPLAAANEMAVSLGLKNLSLVQRDLMAVGKEIGTFDYVIAHGFYAWVPPAVQQRLLEFCREALAPNGIAYVSYNAYPGSRLREAFREMMMFCVRGIEDPQEQVTQAQAYLDFIRRNLAFGSDHGSRMLEEMRKISQSGTGKVFHDELAEHYSPCYFHEFIERVAGHGLQYLGEADFFEMNIDTLPPEAIERLKAPEREGPPEREQSMDFLKTRAFRQTLLCRASVPLRRAPASEDLSKFHVSTRAHPVPPGADTSAPPGAVEYRTRRGASMVTDSLVLLRMMDRLQKAWPGSVPFPELAGLAKDASEAAQIVIQTYASAIVDLHPTAPRFMLQPSATPSVSGLVRLQIERSPIVTNQHHDDVKIDGDLAREVVRRLDGSRDRAGLLRDLAQAGVSVTPEALENGLQQLARLALLTA